MDIPTILFIAVFAGFVGYFIYRMVRHGGFKGAMFGARVEDTVGEVAAEKQGPLSTVIRVHRLSRNSTEKLIGLEFVAKGLTGYQSMPFSLSIAGAQQLSALLQEAARAK